MSLLSGIKFLSRTPKHASTEECVERQQSHSTSTISNEKQGESTGRMGWMETPLPMDLFRSRKEQKQQESVTHPEVESNVSKEERKCKLIEEEISEGKREPVSGLPYGLYIPNKKKGGGWRERVGEQRAHTSGNRNNHSVRADPEEQQWEAVGLGMVRDENAGGKHRDLHSSRQSRDKDVVSRFREKMSVAMATSGHSDKSTFETSEHSAYSRGTQNIRKERERTRRSQSRSRDTRKRRSSHSPNRRSKEARKRSRSKSPRKNNQESSLSLDKSKVTRENQEYELIRHSSAKKENKHNSSKNQTAPPEQQATHTANSGDTYLAGSSKEQKEHAPDSKEASKRTKIGPAPDPGTALTPRMSAAEIRRGAPDDGTNQVLQTSPAVAAPDLNKLMSQALKAKLMGKMDDYDRLMKEVETARIAAAQRNEKQEEEADEEIVIVSSQPENLFTRRGSRNISKEDMRFGSRKGKLKQRHNWEDQLGITDLLANERSSRKGMDDIFAANVRRLGSRFKGAEILPGQGRNTGAGEDEDDDIDMRMYECAEDRMTDKKLHERQKALCIQQHKKWTHAIENCNFCMESRNFKQHRLLAMGDHTILYHSGSEQLTDGHCCILPSKHIEATTDCDEEIWQEIDKFKHCLRKMWASCRKGVIFLETSMQFHRHPHCRIEAVPVEWDAGQDAALYFRQALSEAGEEWATHKKLINTKDKNIRQVIPKEFPYFHVEWEDGGYAQVIEQEELFPRDFGVSVICGMIGIDPPKFNRHASKPSVDEEKKKVLDFLKAWQNFDWTKDLDGGDYINLKS